MIDKIKNIIKPYRSLFYALKHQAPGILSYIYKYVPKNPKIFESLKQFKDIHKGERCFIIATGPSLTLEDVNKLKGELCWTCNSGINLLDSTDWRPDYYALSDGGAYRLVKGKLDQANLKCAFFNERDIEWDYENAHPLPMWVNLYFDRNERIRLPWSWRKKCMSSDISKKVFMGGNVVHVIIQICIYMGFKQIYLLGCDCSSIGQHSKAADFGSNYKLDKSAIARAEYVGYTMLQDYEVAKKFASKHGVQIFNATRGGALEIFPRVDLDDVLKKNKID